MSKIPIRYLPAASHPARQKGFSLVEVLVAVVILSVGVLGAVGMQVASMQSSKEVRYQAIAGSMARELAEKMRGNHEIAIQTTGNPYLLNVTIPASATFSNPNCTTASCTPTQIAALDVAEWQMRLRDALPTPRVRVCMDATPFSGGLPQWDCSNTGDVAVLKLAWNRVNTEGKLEFTSDTVPLLVLPLTAGSSE